MRVWHIASFDGNIGDIANHSGFYKTLESALEGRVYDIEQLEIREFYKNWAKRVFDDSFVDEANQYDLIVIGGGGFFRLAVEESATGTTIDLSRNMLEKIHTPIIFNGIGCYIDDRTTEAIKQKFKDFIDYCIQSKNILLTLRNDGAIDNICTLYGEEYRKKILTVPDGGFFADISTANHPEIKPDVPYIAMNLAGDHESVQEKENCKKIANTLIQVMHTYPTLRVVLVPHIFRDYEVMYKVMSYLPDMMARTRVSCAPYLNGMQTDGLKNMDIYRGAQAVVGMRFHCNVCSIGLGVPVVGFGDDLEIKALYESIGSEPRYILLSQSSDITLYNVIRDMMENKTAYLKDNFRIMEKMNAMKEEYIKNIKAFIY